MKMTSLLVMSVLVPLLVAAVDGCGDAPLEKFVSPTITAAVIGVTSADDKALARVDLAVEMTTSGAISGEDLTVELDTTTLRLHGGEQDQTLLELNARFAPAPRVTLTEVGTTSAKIENVGTTNGALRPHCDAPGAYVEVAVKFVDQSFANVGTTDVTVTCSTK